MLFHSGAADGAAGDVAMGVAWSDNAYSAPDFAVHGSFAHSASPGSTACRAPGVVQSIPLHEIAMEAAAEAAGLSPDKVRELNMYKLGDKALGGVVVGSRGYDWRLPDMWASAKAAWDVDSRRAGVAEFNSRNRWRKRGLALIPTKYGIGVSSTDYHEGCTIGIMPDGSVLIRHGGCEVGQGIHTKAAQVKRGFEGQGRGCREGWAAGARGSCSRERQGLCASLSPRPLPPLAHPPPCPPVPTLAHAYAPRPTPTTPQAASFALGCPLSLITVGDTSSLASPGSLATGGSATSECVVKAVLDAAATLAARILPYRVSTPPQGNQAAQKPDAPPSPQGTPEPPTRADWAAAVAAACAAGVGLQANGWFGGASAGEGVMFDYSTQGVACCETEVDCLTGEVAILRADLLMDQGTPLNPEIDLGQVRHAPMQACGCRTAHTLFASPHFRGGCSTGPLPPSPRTHTKLTPITTALRTLLGL
jgi:xanthine dehydrogenase molybdopterin-binding subunit B